MSRMSKKLINKLNFLLFYFILLSYFFHLYEVKAEKFKIESWIEDIPILTSLIEKKRDIVEFDSSDGKIISISFDSKNLSKEHIYLFYKEFFKEKNWEQDKNKNVWIVKNKTYKKKTFKIEDIDEEFLTIKIITENF